MAVNLTTGSGKITPLEKAVKSLGDTVYIGFDKLFQQLSDKVFRFAGQYGLNGSLDVVEGSKNLSEREKAIFRRELENYLNHQEKERLYSAELASIFSKAYGLSAPTRFQQIILMTRVETEDYFYELNIGLDNAKAAFYNELIYKNNLLGNSIGYTMELTTETAEARFQHLLIKDADGLEKLLSAGRERLYRQIEQELQYAMIRGDKPEEFLFLILNRFRPFQESLKALIETDGSRILSQMDQKLYEFYNVSRYHFAANADERMCKVCGGLYNDSLAAGGLPVSNFAVGISAPSLHPNCRCRTYPEGLKGAETVRQYIHDGSYGPDTGTYIPSPGLGGGISSSKGIGRITEEDILADPAAYYGRDYTALLLEIADALGISLEKLLQDETYRLIIDHIFEGGLPLGNEEDILLLAQEKGVWGVVPSKAVQLLRLFDAGYTARILDTRSRYFPGGDVSQVLRLVSRLYPERSFYIESLPAKYLDALELLILGHERYNMNPEAIGRIIEAARQELSMLISPDPELMAMLDKLIAGPVTLKDAYAFYDKMLEVFEIPPPEERDSTIARNTEAMNIVFLTDPANAYLTYEQRLKILGLYNEGKEQEANALILAWTGDVKRRNDTQFSYTGSRDYKDLASFKDDWLVSSMLDWSSNVMLYRSAEALYNSTRDSLNRLNQTGNPDITTEGGWAGVNTISQALLDELAASGHKYNKDDVVMVTKTPEGELRWLETGNEKNGLQHIVERHFMNFNKRGIYDIPGFLETALQTTPVETGVKSGGYWADYMMDGKLYRVVYGTNGYIVSFHPLS